MGDGEFFSIECFVDGRDRNTVLIMKKENIRDDRILDKEGKKLGVPLYSMFPYVTSESQFPVHTSSYLDGISFPVDWHNAGEEEVLEKLEDIYDTCMEIILTNNEYIPQIFVLKDDIYAYTESDYSGEFNPSMLGDWLIFEKADDGYHILAIMEFQ